MLEELKKIQKEIRKVTDENEKLQRTRERYVQIAERIGEICSELEKIRKEIDPVIYTGRRETNKQRSEIIREIYERMKAGTHITSQLIETTYPELTKIDINNYMQKLKGMNGVEYAKDGTKMRLFIR